MSTRCTTHFIDTFDPTDPAPYTPAIIYRHSDGYPEGAGRDLLDFLNEVGKLKDTRFDDPSYLAARYVVYLAKSFAGENPLDFRSIGVVDKDPGDIQYRYVVNCGIMNEAGQPTVTAYEVSGKRLTEVDIPQ